MLAASQSSNGSTAKNMPENEGQNLEYYKLLTQIAESEKISKIDEKLKLMEEIRKFSPKTPKSPEIEKSGLQKIIVITLALASIAVIGMSGWLALKGEKIPAELIGLGSGAIGSIAGVLNLSSKGS